MEQSKSYIECFGWQKKENITRMKLYFFMAAILSFLFSVYLFFTGDELTAIFVGLWVPSLLAAGNFILGGYKYE
ncbi:MAG: hypothetical protein H6625_01545 [Bdellovibrionaceae bacterium]|nr:hypothetical protein [Pseudobdellovibrionaceae bacterium]